MYITWKHEDTEFPFPLKVDDKITIFYERIFGWQLHIADLCLNGGLDHRGVNQVCIIPHSAFAAMQIMLAYFEMIAKYEDGFIPKNPKQGESAKYFKLGVKSVFPELGKQSQTDVDSFLETFYEKARCGLSHMAQAEAGIVLTGDLQELMRFDTANKVLIINPHRLPAVLKKHLEAYRKRLIDPANVDLQQKFHKRFDFDNPVK
jgi:hypothetical protein